METIFEGSPELMVDNIILRAKAMHSYLYTTMESLEIFFTNAKRELTLGNISPSDYMELQKQYITAIKNLWSHTVAIRTLLHTSRSISRTMQDTNREYLIELKQSIFKVEEFIIKVSNSSP